MSSVYSSWRGVLLSYFFSVGLNLFCSALTIAELRDVGYGREGGRDPRVGCRPGAMLAVGRPIRARSH